MSWCVTVMSAEEFDESEGDRLQRGADREHAVARGRLA
jgi:hypothetical protein